MKKKLLVYGATGFIGRNIVEYFAEKPEFEVYGTYHKSSPLDNKNIQMLKADLTKAEDVYRVIQGMDIIVQAAAITSGAKDIVDKPYIHITDNVIMNSLIFRAAHENNVSHLIFFSCTLMYHTSERPLKESDFDANLEMYPNYFGGGWLKVYLEKQAEFYSRLGRTKFTVLRHSNVYGPFDKYDMERSHVFGATVTKVMNNKDGKIIVWGTGEAGRDLIYVSDIVSFAEAAILKQKDMFGLYNVGIGKAVTVKELVQRIIGISGKDIAIEFDTSKPDLKTKLCLDCNKAKEDFNWEPEVKLDDGIKKTILWYKKNVIASELETV